MGIEVTISNTPNKRVFAGDTVEGIVEVEVDAKDKQGSPAERLTLKLEGHSETVVDYRPFWSNHDFRASSKRALISATIELTTFAGKASHGTHTFPFSFSLPPDIPGSIKEEGCEVSYFFEAHVSRPGLLNFDVKSSLPLTVFAKRQGLFAPQFMAGPETRPVKIYCCLNGGGSTSFAFLVDSQAVGRADDVGITMVARNDSLSTFESLQLGIHQQARYRAEGHPGYALRTVTSRTFEDGELCVSKKMDGPRRASKVGEDASGDLKQMLASGSGTRYALTVPDTCADTVSLPDIDITHTLVVKLKTSTCSEEPSFSIPILVYQGMSVGDNQLEGVQLVRQVLSQSPEHGPQSTASTLHTTPQPKHQYPVQQQPTGRQVLPFEDQTQHAPENAMLQQGSPTQQQPTGFEDQAAACSDLTQVTVTGSPPVEAPAGGIWVEKSFRGRYTCKFALVGAAVAALSPVLIAPSTVFLVPAGALLACLCPCDERMVYAHGGVNFKENGKEAGWFC